jgi:hypothetical protein
MRIGKPGRPGCHSGQDRARPHLAVCRAGHGRRRSCSHRHPAVPDACTCLTSPVGRPGTGGSGRGRVQVRAEPAWQSGLHVGTSPFLAAARRSIIGQAGAAPGTSPMAETYRGCRFLAPRCGTARPLPAPGAYWGHGPDDMGDPRRDPRRLGCFHGHRLDRADGENVCRHRADRGRRGNCGVAAGQAPSPRLAPRSCRGCPVRVTARWWRPHDLSAAAWRRCGLYRVHSQRTGGAGTGGLAAVSGAAMAAGAEDGAGVVAGRTAAK